MESYILLHNTFYKTASEILIHNTKSLLEQLQIPCTRVEKLALDLQFLPNINPLSFYSKILNLLINAKKEGAKILICDSQSLLAFVDFFSKLYTNAELKASLKDSLESDFDALELENSFVVAPLLIFGALEKANIKKQRWSGFRAALMLDRALEPLVKEKQIIAQIEGITGLKILPFFKESYGYLLEVNKNLAYKMGAMDYYEMVDCGVDFIITPNLANFALMDGCAKEIKKAVGRDDLEIPILTIPQVLLALFDSSTKESLQFSLHKIPPKML